MNRGRITWLLESFQALVAAAGPARRWHALETLLSRGRFSNHGPGYGDELRCSLFGLAIKSSAPVAALTRIADGAADADDGSYWLRLDPVSLRADMTRVIMTGHGFADLNEPERREIENTVRSVAVQEGIGFHTHHPERWSLGLQQPLPFDFTPLEDALGMDLAEVLPNHPAALYWRRFLNEIQMALHACPVNARRRRLGRSEINSVWIWGGGFTPSAASGRTYDAVYADRPVTRGLAMLHGCALSELNAAANADFGQNRGSILLDWSRPVKDPEVELERLERLAGRVLELVKHQGFSVDLCMSGGTHYFFDRRCLRRWWKRRNPLAYYHHCAQP